MKKDFQLSKVGIICDISGKDDEGMKKVARNLAVVINAYPDYTVDTISTWDCLKLSSDYDIFHFIGGPTYKTIVVSFVCRLLNSKLKTFLTFTNPFLGRFSLKLMSFFRPTLCLVSSKKWFYILKDLDVPVTIFNVSGVNTKKFLPVKEEKKRGLRKKLNLPDDSLVVLHVGHLKRDRNLSALLTLQKDPDVQIVIVGSTTTNQSIEEVKILDDAGCIVVTDYIPCIEEFYQSADCYIFPTINERAAIQIPLSILEALAVGIPVITTEFGGLKDVLGNYGGKIRYFHKNEFGILNKLIKKHVQGEKYSLDEAASIEWDHIASQLVALYEK